MERDRPPTCIVTVSHVDLYMALRASMFSLFSNISFLFSNTFNLKNEMQLFHMNKFALK